MTRVYLLANARSTTEPRAHRIRGPRTDLHRIITCLAGIAALYGSGVAWADGKICVRGPNAASELTLDVEFATSPAQRAHGLMDRISLPENAGMLFVFDTLQPPVSGFWMQHVNFPLDIAFIDAAGRIQAIRTMPRCDSSHAKPCPVYPAGVTFQQALEVNAGFFAAYGIVVGGNVGRCPGMNSSPPP